MIKTLIIINLIIIISISIICIIINLIPSNNKNIHPIIIGLILLILTIFTSINIRIYINSHWFSFIIFLILIGGIIILFLYFTRFIRNIKITIKWIFLYSIPIKFLILIILLLNIILILNYNFNWYNNFNEIKSINEIIKLNSINNNYIYIYIFIENKNLSTIISILYLLICLTLIVKFCINKKFSIRKIN